MASITPTVIDVSDRKDGSAIMVSWVDGGANNSANTYLPVSYPKHSNKSIQVLGTFGGASVAIQGSNDIVGTPTNFASLNDPGGTVIAITSAKIKAVLENTVHIQPVATGGTSQNLTIQMLLQYANPART